MKKKKVLISAPAYYGIDRDIKEAFEYAGCSVVLDNYRINFSLLENVCRLTGIRYPFLKPVLNQVIKFHLNRENREFLDKVMMERPDLLFIIKGDHLFPSTLKRLKESSPCLIAGYAWDDPFYTDENNLQDDFRRSNFGNGLEWYDHIFVFDTWYVKEIRRRGAAHVSYLPLATNPDRYREIFLSDEERRFYGHDVCFIGVPFDNRVEIFEKLDGIDLGVYGDYWTKYFLKKGQRTPPYYKGKAAGDTVNRIYLASKIVLNIHHPHSVEGLNTRTFDIPACGAFEVVDHINTMERHFEIGKELVTFRGVDDLKEKIALYLGDDSLREKIAGKGKKRVVKDHTWKNRIAEVVAVMEGKANSSH